MQQPKSLEETEAVLKTHKLKRKRTIDQLQIDQLTTEGLKINRLIKQESEERCVCVCGWVGGWVCVGGWVAESVCVCMHYIVCEL